MHLFDFHVKASYDLTNRNNRANKEMEMNQSAWNFYRSSRDWKLLSVINPRPSADRSWACFTAVSNDPVFQCARSRPVEINRNGDETIQSFSILQFPDRREILLKWSIIQKFYTVVKKKITWQARLINPKELHVTQILQFISGRLPYFNTSFQQTFSRASLEFQNFIKM